MSFLIQRTDQGGGYVARDGSKSSYTKNLRAAKVFPTKEAANRDRCPGNEIVVSVFEVTRRNGSIDR